MTEAKIHAFETKNPMRARQIRKEIQDALNADPQGQEDLQSAIMRHNFEAAQKENTELSQLFETYYDRDERNAHLIALAYAYMNPMNKLIDDKSVSDEEFGRLIREAIGEANHGSWDSIEPFELIAYGRLLGDLATYVRSAID